LFSDIKSQFSCIFSIYPFFESTNLNDCKVKNLYILLKYIKPVQWHFVKVDEDIKSGLNICVTDKKSGSLAQNNVSVDAQLHPEAAGNFQRRFAFPA
jgi:hypothetical protein